mmetsp:Transcript_5235/g.15365  ORF Transcript_5235/g.15365 Transcript_5235/m.15365 type:complete len:196 (-) Transcript_5235:221-808(-)
MAPCEALSLLLKASSKAVVLRAFHRVFVCRRLPHDAVPGLVEDLALDDQAQGQELADSIANIIQSALQTSDVDQTMEEVARTAPGLDARLTDLVRQLLTSQLPEWREASIMQRPSLPRFVDIDWRIDVKTASDRVSRMSLPTVLVDLQVEAPPENVSAMPSTRHVDFELSREALQTMLDGLGRIKDQLGFVAGGQ